MKLLTLLGTESWIVKVSEETVEMFGSWQSCLGKGSASSSKGRQWVLSGRQADGAVLPRGGCKQLSWCWALYDRELEPGYRAQCCPQISDTEGDKPRQESLQGMRFCGSHGRDSSLGNPLLLPPCSPPQSQPSFHAPVPSPLICAAKIAVEQNVNLTSILECLLLKLFWSAFPFAKCTYSLFAQVN